MTQTMKKYADVVRAYLDGAEVQVRYCVAGDWLDEESPDFSDTYCEDYRVKPNDEQQKD